MTDHPITPPPELVQQWIRERDGLEHLATQAARWGADQELEACCEWFQELYKSGDVLRAARRPKPPSLKEQALEALNSFEGFTGSLEEVVTIRRAVEALPE